MSTDSSRKRPAEDTQEFSEGDWSCAFCQDHNFARRTSCRQCNFPKADTLNPGADHDALVANWKSGDWKCGDCGEHNFAARLQCRKCNFPKNFTKEELEGRDVKPGDWKCSSCGDHNFASRDSCRKCMKPKLDPRFMGRGAFMPSGRGGGFMQGFGRGFGYTTFGPGGGFGAFGGGFGRGMASFGPMSMPFVGGMGGPPGFKPGDWNCKKCNDHNFASRTECRKCKQPK